MNIKLDLWSSGNPAHNARKKFSELFYDKYWTGKKGEVLTDEKIKDNIIQISNVNIDGIRLYIILIFKIEYIAYFILILNIGKK